MLRKKIVQSFDPSFIFGYSVPFLLFFLTLRLMMRIFDNFMSQVFMFFLSNFKHPNRSIRDNSKKKERNKEENGMVKRCCFSAIIVKRIEKLIKKDNTLIK